MRKHSQPSFPPLKTHRGLTSMSVRLGTRALTSRMTLGLAVGSNDSSVTLNIVFSLGFSYNQVCSVSGCRDRHRRRLTTSSASAGAAAAGAADAAGIAISCMFKRDCIKVHQHLWLYRNLTDATYLEQSYKVCCLQKSQPRNVIHYSPNLWVRRCSGWRRWGWRWSCFSSSSCHTPKLIWRSCVTMSCTE